MNAITQETLSVSGVMLTKLFGRQDDEVRRFNRENQRLSNLVIRRQMTGQVVWAIMQGFFSVSPVIIYVLAGTCWWAWDGRAFRRDHRRLHHPAVEALLSHRDAAEGFGGIAGFPGAVRADLRLPGHRAGHSRRADAVDLDAEAVTGLVEFDSVRVDYGAHSIADPPEREQEIAPTDGRTPQWAWTESAFASSRASWRRSSGPAGREEHHILPAAPPYDASEGW